MTTIIYSIHHPISLFDSFKAVKIILFQSVWHYHSELYRVYSTSTLLSSAFNYPPWHKLNTDIVWLKWQQVGACSRWSKLCYLTDLLPASHYFRVSIPAEYWYWHSVSLLYILSTQCSQWIHKKILLRNVTVSALKSVTQPSSRCGKEPMQPVKKNTLCFRDSFESILLIAPSGALLLGDTTDLPSTSAETRCLFNIC